MNYDQAFAVCIVYRHWKYVHPFINEVIPIYNSMINRDYVDKKHVIEISDKVRIFFLKEDEDNHNALEEVEELLMKSYEERVFNKNNNNK